MGFSDPGQSVVASRGNPGQHDPWQAVATPRVATTCHHRLSRIRETNKPQNQEVAKMIFSTQEKHREIIGKA